MIKNPEDNTMAVTSTGTPVQLGKIYRTIDEGAMNEATTFVSGSIVRVVSIGSQGYGSATGAHPKTLLHCELLLGDLSDRYKPLYNPPQERESYLVFSTELEEIITEE